MKKLIIALIVLIFNLPGYSSVLVYKYKGTNFGFNFDLQEAEWKQFKNKDEAYFVIDTTSGNIEMVKYSRREKNFQVLADDNRAFTKVSMKKKSVWVITDFWSGGGFWGECQFTGYDTYHHNISDTHRKLYFLANFYFQGRNLSHCEATNCVS